MRLEVDSFEDRPPKIAMATGLDGVQEQLSDTLLTLESEFAELEAEYGCSLEQSLSVDQDTNITTMETDPSGESFATNSVGRVGGKSEEYEQTVSDVKEQQDIQKFLVDTCKCKLGSRGKPCCLSFSMETIRSCRNNCAELSHNELDLVVISQVHYLRTVEHLSVPRAHSSTSFRHISTYFIHGMKIYLTTFLFLHRISRNRYLCIIALYNKEGLAPTVHGNKGNFQPTPSVLSRWY